MQYYYFIIPIIYTLIYTTFIKRKIDHGFSRAAIIELFLFTLILCLYLSPRTINSDFLAYKEHYDQIVSGYSERAPIFMHWEFLYEGLNKICASWGVEYWFVFFLMLNVMIQPVLYFIATEKNLYRYLPIIAILFVFFNLGHMGNAIRQSAAIACFLLSLKYIISRNLIKYSLCFLIGYGFHFSILFFYPLYFIVPRIKIPSIKIQVIFYVACYLIGLLLLKFMRPIMMFLAINVGKIYSTDSSNDILREDFGIGVFIMIVQYLMIVIYYPSMRKRLDYKSIDQLYVIFMGGLCLYFVLLSQSIDSLGRSNYLIFVYYILLGVWFSYMYTVKNVNIRNWLIFYAFSIYHIIAFLLHLSLDHFAGLVPLKFIWER